jgi:hypothetical protein
MNLLPHKSWNVWSAKNKEKVRKDEEKHKEKEQQERRKFEQAEQEARYYLLKSKARKRKNEEEEEREDGEEGKSERQSKRPKENGNGRDGDSEVINPLAVGTLPSTLPSEHLNLFVNFMERNSGRPPGSEGRNPEYEEEKRVKELKQQQRETTYLAQSSSEAKKGDTKPWYQKKLDTKTVYPGLTQAQQE